MAKWYTVRLGIALSLGLSACAKSRVLLCPIPAELPAVVSQATYKGHTYRLLEASAWCAAESVAESLGARLVTINDAEENAFVFSTFGGDAREIWLSLNDLATEGLFTWPSGLPLVYTNWAAGEPNDADSTEDCVVQTISGDWNDVSCEATGTHLNTAKLHGVVELEYVE